jgi:hypothetical protein
MATQIDGGERHENENKNDRSTDHLCDSAFIDDSFSDTSYGAPGAQSTILDKFNDQYFALYRHDPDPFAVTEEKPSVLPRCPDYSHCLTVL